MEGKKYLKFAGIILVIIGVAQLLLACLAFAGGGIAALDIEAGAGNDLMVSGAVAVIGGIMLVINAVFNLIFGIMAVRNCENAAVIIATKADKISKVRQKKAVDNIFNTLRPRKRSDVILFSAATKMGKDEAWEVIEERL